MKCEDYQEMISLYLDDALSLDEKQRLEEHLKHCLSCRETLEALRMITRELAQIEEVELPQKFHEELSNRLRQDKKRHRSLSKWIPYVAGLAAAFVIGFVMVENTNFINPKVDLEPAGYQLEAGEVSVTSLAAEPAPAQFAAKARTMSEEIWTLQCTNIEQAETFLESYTKMQDISMTKWQEETFYHYVLEFVQDKEDLKNSIEKAGLVMLDSTSMLEEVQTIHLVISIKE